MASDFAQELLARLAMGSSSSPRPWLDPMRQCIQSMPAWSAGDGTSAWHPAIEHASQATQIAQRALVSRRASGVVLCDEDVDSPGDGSVSNPGGSDAMLTASDHAAAAVSQRAEEEAQLACAMISLCVSRLAGAEHQAMLLEALTRLALQSSQLLLAACQGWAGEAERALPPPGLPAGSHHTDSTGGRPGECSGASISGAANTSPPCGPAPDAGAAVRAAPAACSVHDMAQAAARAALGGEGVACSHHLSEHATLLARWLDAQRYVALAAGAMHAQPPALADLWLSVKVRGMAWHDLVAWRHAHAMARAVACTLLSPRHPEALHNCTHLPT